MNPMPELSPLLKQLRLSGILDSLEARNREAIENKLAYPEFLALLIGVQPDEVDAWYLGIYIDAIEWVEMPNTRGMSQFADGGVIASKPYVSSGNYINKMSDHCKGCHFDVKTRSGDKACPFNPLYWHFMERHRDRLEKNPRIGMVYRNWDRMDEERREAILETAERIIEDPDRL